MDNVTIPNEPPTVDLDALNKALAVEADPPDGGFPQLSAFTDAVGELLADKEDKYPDENWRYIPKLEFEQRVLQKIEGYAVMHEGARVPLPWIKMAAYCLLGWVKETYPGSNRDRVNCELKRGGGPNSVDPRG